MKKLETLDSHIKELSKKPEFLRKLEKERLKYMKTAKEVMTETGISRARLSQITNGNRIIRNGKIEFTEPALLIEGVDFERTKKGVMFGESAVEKIKGKLNK